MTEAEKKERKKALDRLFPLLKEQGVDRATALGVSLLVRRPQHMEQMIEWLQTHKATPEEICDKAGEINAIR